MRNLEQELKEARAERDAAEQRAERMFKAVRMAANCERGWLQACVDILDAETKRVEDSW